MSVEPRVVSEHGTNKGSKHDNSSNGNGTVDMVAKDRLVSLVASAQVGTGMALVNCYGGVRVLLSSRARAERTLCCHSVSFRFFSY